jgi:hypothetical protein
MHIPEKVGAPLQFAMFTFVVQCTTEPQYSLKYGPQNHVSTYEIMSAQFYQYTFILFSFEIKVNTSSQLISYGKLPVIRLEMAAL